MDKNLELVKLAQNGDSSATQSLYTENIKLIGSIASRFIGRGQDMSDLMQIAAIGLLKAISAFDTTRGLKFSTYAVPVITGEIKRFLRDDGIIKVSRSLKERKAHAKRAEEELRRQLGREPTVSEVARSCGITAEELCEAYDACLPIESIDAPQDSDYSISERIGRSVEDSIIDNITAKELLSGLSAREREVILLRYFEERTQSYIAKLIGVSQVQISRIERKALQKLRQLLAE